jgi:GntR family transcriptional repressor for pyruvate dehydrogenase complex
MPEILERRNLSETVAERIKQYIIDNGLKPGDRLPTEQELCDRFGVSRVCTREATKALSFLGIIDAAPRRGLAVGRLDMKRVTHYLGFHFAISDFPLAQLLDARNVIETGALPHVMRQMAKDPAIYSRLTAQAEEARRPGKNLDQRIAADVAFHHALLDASGVQPLLAFHDLLTIFFDRFRRSLARGDWEGGMKQHLEILDALRAGELTRACDLLAAHLEHHRKLV